MNLIQEMDLNTTKKDKSITMEDTENGEIENNPLHLNLENIQRPTFQTSKTIESKDTEPFYTERPHPDSSRYFENYKLKSRVPFRSREKKEIKTLRARRSPNSRRFGREEKST